MSGRTPENSRSVALIVLDGWGYRASSEGNAIAMAPTPNWDRLWSAAPRTLLQASGTDVGLPPGQMGNSEVGHLNLGAGRVIKQDMVRISDSIETGDFYQNPALTDLFNRVKSNGGTLHLIGLVGTGGVHAVHHHWQGTLEAARRHSVPRVAIHGFLDGRDSPPRSAAGFVRSLEETASRASGSDTKCYLASVTGRYHAMDRDKRWDRTRLAYDAMVNRLGKRVQSALEGIEEAYSRDETDEFIRPLLVDLPEELDGRIKDGDGVFCLNFRADRMRQIVGALAVPGFDGFDVSDRPSISLATMTQYDESFSFPTAFEPVTMRRIVGEVISEAGLPQLRTAETEKYAHVTYFFNCGYETPFAGEERRLVPSPRVATYDLQPEMSAAGITDTLCSALEAREHRFFLCNFANGDMVGHTGDIPATLKAVETVDTCLGRILESAERSNTTLLITADHGNCEVMIDPGTGGPHTAHTTNPVPLVIVGDPETRRLREGGRLSDVGPTILNYFGLDRPDEMTGRDLREGFEA